MSDDLWTFACRLYGTEGVREFCLELQDEHGVDVPLLLTTCWLWRRGVALDEMRRQRLAAACAPWQREVVAPLRAARRALRPAAAPRRELIVPAEKRGELKARVQALELEAERCQLDALAALTADWPDAAVPGELVDHLLPLAPDVNPSERWTVLVDSARHTATAAGEAGAVRGSDVPGHGFSTEESP